MYSVIMRYYHFGVTTSITEVKESPMEFPAVTICNNNQYHKSVVEQYDDIAGGIYSTSDV